MPLELYKEREIGAEKMFEEIFENFPFGKKYHL